MSIKKVLTLLAVSVSALILSISSVGCSGDNGVNGRDGTKGEDGVDGKDGVTPTVAIDPLTGNWVINDVNTGISATGAPGTPGTAPHIDAISGYWFVGTVNTGVKAEGTDGAPGTTPHIDPTTGNWFIGIVNTGVKAEGTPGTPGTAPHIDETTGNWFIGTVNTGVKAEGTDGTTPTINIHETDSTWVINDVNTNVKVRGKDGEDGKSCTVAPKVGNPAYLVMTCEDGTSEEWPKALCGATAYDPDGDKFCSGTTLHNKCGGLTYSPRNQYCFNGTLQDIITDARDNRRYRTIKIGEQTWFAENLNYAGAGGNVGICYNNSADSCVKYGRLYKWVEAMDIDPTYETSLWSGSDEGRKGVCPVGWHVPSSTEWDILMTAVGGISTAGTKLKSTYGWYNNGNGTDDYGFSALPGGYRYSGGSFYDAGYGGYWWSATEYDATYARYRLMLYDNDGVYSYWYYKSNEQSLRCLRD